MMQPTESTGQCQDNLQIRLSTGTCTAPHSLCFVVSHTIWVQDICKDWKETGFCGYGASCKFLHDRGDYKAGWQMEKDWEKAQQLKLARTRGTGTVEEEEENWEISDDDDDPLDADGLPFACFLCRDGFTDPVVTRFVIHSRDSAAVWWLPTTV